MGIFLGLPRDYRDPGRFTGIVISGEKAWESGRGKRRFILDVTHIPQFDVLDRKGSKDSLRFTTKKVYRRRFLEGKGADFEGLVFPPATYTRGGFVG